MHNISVSNKILEKIRAEKIKPEPRWKFLLKNYTLWAAFGLAVILGSLAFAVILFFLIERDWDIYKNLNKSFLEYVIISLPKLWVVFIIGFVGLAYYNWKHTKKGYKQNPFLIVIGSVAVSLLLGAGLYGAGMGEKMDQAFADYSPCCYKGLTQKRMEVWNQPEKGLLSGEITRVEDESITIKDFEGKEWIIEDESASKRGMIEIKKGEKIKILGEKENSNNSFKAEEIRPWEKRNGRMRSGSEKAPNKMDGQGKGMMKNGNERK